MKVNEYFMTLFGRINQLIESARTGSKIKLPVMDRRMMTGRSDETTGCTEFLDTMYKEYKKTHSSEEDTYYTTDTTEIDLEWIKNYLEKKRGELSKQIHERYTDTSSLKGVWKMITSFGGRKFTLLEGHKVTRIFTSPTFFGLLSKEISLVEDLIKKIPREEHKSLLADASRSSYT